MLKQGKKSERRIAMAGFAGQTEETGRQDIQVSDAELQALAEEIPAMALIRRFARSTLSVAWFSQVGRPLNPVTRKLAQSYLDALGIAHIGIAPLHDWREASEAAETYGFDSPQFETEEQLRAALSDRALAHMSERALEVVLTHVTACATAALDSRLEEEAELWELKDEAVLTAARGAALAAAHNAALVLAGGAADGHALAQKYRLFELGRWPVGIAGASFNLF
jgi:hypothetical protein